MSFASPNTLLLLLIILPLVWRIGWPRFAFRRRRDIASLLLRTVIMILMVMALAGFQIVRQVDKLAVIFLVDASDSIGTEIREEQALYIQNAIATKPVDDEWALVVFGANVSIDTPFSNITELGAIRSTVLGSNTNIAEAVQTAMSLFPADARRRIVILSDGIQTIGDAEAKARLAEASGVEISYVLFSREASPDVRIVEFSSPARVNEGQEFDITITIEADEATNARLQIYAGNQLLREQDLSLRAGLNSFNIPERSSSTGFLNFSARIIVPNAQDSFTQNNSLGTFSQVVGPPRILVVSDNPSDIANLVPALENAGMIVEVTSPASLPADTGALVSYASVVIVDVPAALLSNEQQIRLQSYVRDLGGGLVFVGGPDSYGTGGYSATPIEAMLPVENQIRDQQRLPSLTIAYLIDSSGSMAVSGDGVFSGLQLEQRAVNLSISLLQPTDRVGVLTFETQGSLVVPFQNVGDGSLLYGAVNSLGTGGGTDILAGLRTAETYMLAEQSDRKHLILMTDGGASERELVETAERLNLEQGITLTVIGVGESLPPFLEEMAEAGNGSFYPVINVAQIPNILAQETILATRSYVQEGDFGIAAVSNNPILTGLSQPPNLNGYIATTERDTAQVILNAPEPFGDPILAVWQYGLGRTVAFTSDATGRWASGWVTWGDFSRFWGQVVSYSIIESASNNLETRVTMIDGQAHIEVDARAEDGSFLNNLLLQASIIDPNGLSQSIALQQSAPARYSAVFTPSVEGSYYLAISGGGDFNGQTLSFNERSGWVMSYSAEYSQNEPNEALLSDIAEMTGGSDLRETPSASFLSTQVPRTAAVPVWQWLLLIAMLLFPIDIALRRVIITRSDIQRFRVWVQGQDSVGTPQERLSNLFEARERARSKTEASTSDMSALAALRQAKEESRREVEQAPVSAARSDARLPSPVAKPDTPLEPIVPTPRTQSEGEFQVRNTGKAVETVSDLLKRRKGRGEEEKPSGE
jgi:Ca-activated chloride channel family protein